ncbi:ArsR/SmtB family transcription factor [Nonomuraea basaltis]|uniref:ArsR/SmtB family transcription factor n=1 Tax=Nonomuraea basaltis TaxID=2495887 RepID=UPI00110C5F63|nr:metalloregulator ArsR/SmtB family transcription factor [Nonomuraea basaltis]TMR90151.1 winged helix-turn-helix transcriptional regulator [Nonomuraea basaltis]
MAIPPAQAKADLFRALAHPLRLRVVRLLTDGPCRVRELLAEVDVEPSCLSQQLAILRGAGVVTASRSGGTVVYTLASPHTAGLLHAARRALFAIVTRQIPMEEHSDHAG